MVDDLHGFSQSQTARDERCRHFSDGMSDDTARTNAPGGPQRGQSDLNGLDRRLGDVGLIDL